MQFGRGLWDSVVNFTAYRDFSRQPVGRGIKYLILVVLLFGTVTLIDLSLQFNRGLDKLSALAVQLPVFSLQDGALTVKAPMPIMIRGDRDLVVIDTTGKTDERILDGYESGTLITKTSLINKSGAAQIHTFNYTSYPGLKLSNASLLSLLPKLKWLDLGIVILGLIYFIAAKLLSMLLFAVMAMLCGAIHRVKLTYDRALVVAAYAMTLPIIYQTVSTIFFPNFRFNGWVYYLLVIAYLWLGVWGCRDQEAVPPINLP